MAQTEMRSGICPKCGEKLEIPVQLKQFSCMYCGARLSLADLEVPFAEPLISSDEARQARGYYEAHILEVITNHKGIEQKLTKTGYGPAMDQYAEANRQIFDSLNTAHAAGVLTLEEAAAQFLDQLENRWNNSRKNTNSLREQDKFVIAIFLIPMIRRLALPCSEDYCITLHAQWRKRYPKSIFEIGDYDTINAGFKKKFLGLCFITTAVCQQSGKPDDCAELTAFRSFRDGYLRACSDGPMLIDRYYQIAPSIVLEIEKTPDKAARYDAIWQTYLVPCYNDLQTGRLQQCKVRYEQMVHELEKEYLS